MTTTPRRIHVVSFTGDSGLTDYGVSLCRELEKFADVTFVTADSYDPARYQVSFPHVKIFHRTRQYPIDIFRYIFHALKTRPDFVLWQSWLKYPLLEGWIVMLLRLSGIRTALTIHDLLPHKPKPWSRLVCAWFYRRFDKLVVHSVRSVDGLRAMGVRTEPLLVPHGVYDIFRLSHLTRERARAEIPGIGVDDFVVLFFGHIDVRKGILEFLRTSELMRDQTRIKFVVAGARASTLPIGAAEELDRYKDAANVIMHDHLIPFELVQYYFTAAHVVALPYLEGTTSGVIKLAMAFDRPFIATDIGDFAETLRDWSGLLTPGEEPATEFVDAILRMRRDFEYYSSELADKSAKYQWSHIAAAHAKYLSLV